MFYEIFCLVVATLGIAHQDEADRVFIFCCCLDKRDVVVVDIAFGMVSRPSYDGNRSDHMQTRICIGIMVEFVYT